MPAKNTVKEYKENTYYHIYNRGVARQKIFLDKNDYKKILSYLKLYLTPFDLEKQSIKVSPTKMLKNYYGEITLLTYCLMPNHFHLDIIPMNQEVIPKFMRQMTNAYTEYFNKKYDRVGPLLQGRYKSILLDSEECAVHVHRYIHLNPLRAGLVKSLGGWTWSSYGEYKSLGKSGDDLCVRNRILSRFRDFSDYKKFLLSEISEREDLKVLEID